MKDKQILKELRFIEKINTSHGMLDYDGFAADVLRFMDKLKKFIKKEKNKTTMTTEQRLGVFLWGKFIKNDAIKAAHQIMPFISQEHTRWDTELRERADKLIEDSSNDIMLEGQTLIGYARGIDDLLSLLESKEEEAE